MSVIAQQMLTGLTRPALQQIGNHRLQPAAAAAFFLMQQAAAAEGINISIASSYRDFATQLRIGRANSLVNDRYLISTRN